MSTHRQDELAISQQAAEWLTALEESDADRRAAFATWLVQSPVHVREFLNLTAIHRLFDDLDPQKRIDVLALLGGTAPNVVKLAPGKAGEITPRSIHPTGRDEGRSVSHWRRTLGIAAAVALVTVCAWVGFARLEWRSYATAVGEQRSIELDDGSLLYLSAQSRLQVRFDANARNIRLLQGEALFTAQRDARRPFRVHAAKAVIQAVGTQFNVNRRTRDTTVAVIEGAVRVTGDGQTGTISPALPVPKGEQKNAKDVLLTAGNAVRVAQSGALSAPESVDTARVASWRERRFVFQSDTLEDMAAQFNRYNRTPKVRIEGDTIGQRRFTGVLDAGHPESLLNLLAEADDLAFERRGDELIIRARP